MWILIILLGIVTFPISLLLDAFLGRESIADMMFNREDLKELVHLHTESVRPGPEEHLQMIEGSLNTQEVFPMILLPKFRLQ